MSNKEFLNKKKERENENENNIKAMKKTKIEEKEEKENKIDIKNIIDKAFDDFINGNNKEFIKNFEILSNNINSVFNKIIKK